MRGQRAIGNVLYSFRKLVPGGLQRTYVWDMHATVPFSSPPHQDATSLWMRAVAMLGSLLGFVGSPAGLLRERDTSRRERREIGIMLAPVEAMVRSLLMSAAIVWLTTTDEGEAMLREAAREARRAECQPPPRRAAVSSCAAPQEDARADEALAAPEAVPESTLTDADVQSLLAPQHCRFKLQEPCEWNRQRRPARRHARAAHARRARRKPPRNLALARRYEALCNAMADPDAAMLAMAHDLARRNLDMLYVPTPRNWIDAAWGRAHADIRLARRASCTRFRWYQAYRNRTRLLALPPPEPG